MFDAVFIDADNTLFDFDRTEYKAFQASLAQYDLPSDDDAIADYRRINRECWALFEQGRISNDDIGPLRWGRWLSEVIDGQNINAAQLSSYYNNALAEQCEKEDGAEALIQYLTEKVPVHVITNGFPTSQAHRWRLAGWEDRLHGITVSATVGVKKPDPEIFHLAMAKVGVTDPGACLMIGDSLEADVLGPQGIGMKGCWYQRNGALNETDIEPDFVVSHLDGIREIV